MTTGSGEDIIHTNLYDPFDSDYPDDGNFMRVTDFHPDHDIVSFEDDDGLKNNPELVEIVEAEDGSYTDLKLTYVVNDSGTEDIGEYIRIIRLEGTTGVTLANLRFATTTA